MSELTEKKLELLRVLVEAEDRAIADARAEGCECSGPAMGIDRDYPYALFSTNEVTAAMVRGGNIPLKLVHRYRCHLYDE